MLRKSIEWNFQVATTVIFRRWQASSGDIHL